MQAELILYTIIFLYGIIIGSFLNVLIYRIPKKENFTTERSHCMKCGAKIAWYDLIPLFSYLILGGKCRNCKDKISIQYPLIEALNGILYLVVFFVNGFTMDSVLICVITSIFIVISVIDWRTYEIPFGLNVAIFLMAIVRVFLHRDDVINYLIGMVAVSGFMLICLMISRVTIKQDAFGGGDIKLMAVAGLFAGWQQVILGFVFGCIIGAVVHSIRMKVTDADRVLAFGPYLCIGLFISILFGTEMIEWYLSLL